MNRGEKKLDGPPALIVGGHGNSLSVARSLTRRGVKVRALTSPDWPIVHSNAAEIIPLPGKAFFEAAEEYLTGPASDHLAGSVLFLNMTDDGLDILLRRRDELATRFMLDLCDLDAQTRMLDKIATYEAAKEAGVPAPRYWLLDEDVQAVPLDVTFPLIVKPRHSHEVFGVLGGDRKHIVARDRDEAEEALRVFSEAGVRTLLVEKIDGPDDLLCSYYTYMDENGKALLDFTKRVIRRFPKNEGLGTYHITDHVGGLKERSLKLFRSVGLQGIGNIEYKLDTRDGEYKLIECNARFTAATSLLAASGLDLGEFVYRRIAGLPPMELDGFRDGVRLWEPRRDLFAYRELRRLGEITFWEWVRSILHLQTFPFWSWRDPRPSLVLFVESVRKRFRRWTRFRRS